MQRTDKFEPLKLLLHRLVDTLVCKLMQNTQFLQEVCQIYVSFDKCDIMKYMELVYLLKALEDQFLDSSNFDLLVQELNQK